MIEPQALATDATPRGLTLPLPLVESVVRAGKDAVIYRMEVCGGAPPTVISVEQSTRFPDVDQFIDSHITDLGLDLPTSGCVGAEIILRSFSRAYDVQW